MSIAVILIAFVPALVAPIVAVTTRSKSKTIMAGIAIGLLGALTGNPAFALLDAAAAIGGLWLALRIFPTTLDQGPLPEAKRTPERAAPLPEVILGPSSVVNGPRPASAPRSRPDFARPITCGSSEIRPAPVPRTGSVSYIVAFVKYSDAAKEYPVACFRTDVIRGDDVIVSLGDGRFVRSTVVAVKYLNWACTSRIVCKASEATLIDGRLNLLEGTPSRVGLVSADWLISLLRDRGWTPLKYINTYRIVLAYNNDLQTARIWVRKNGVDLQLLPDKQPMPRPFSQLSNALTEGRFVRHYLAHTTFNLFEGIMRFAQSFEAGEGLYDRFFVPVGRPDRRTEALKEASERRKRDRLFKRDDEFDPADYVASNGGGDRAYLGDGMWVTSDGRFEDSGH
jgi:hypothetical protein